MMSTVTAFVAKYSSALPVKRMELGQRLEYFILAVSGFSFWFLLAVPFASHRETYWWLAEVHNHSFGRSLDFISVTYRPLAQAATWFGFMLVNPRIFPTSIARQTLLQSTIWGLFLLAWWLIWKAAEERRLLSWLALLAGGVFFAGYVHLFHIYGIMYVPVMLMLGAVLLFNASRFPDQREVWLGLAAIVLVAWHPFATALFLGYYVGFYLESFRVRSRALHARAIAILLTTAAAVAVTVVVFPRADVAVPMHTKLTGFLESYRATEVNGAASAVAFLFALLVVLGMSLSPKMKATALAACVILGLILMAAGLPLLLLWVSAALLKLYRGRCWGLFLVLLGAAVLPYGAVIGAPVFALFAVIVATYVTAMGWPAGERALSFVKTAYLTAALCTMAVILVLMRVGVHVPVVTQAARPLLAERDRTYQLEKVLEWLHESPYCADAVGFAENADSPIDSIENIRARQHRPPASIDEVQLFWNGVLRCRKAQPSTGEGDTVIVTFGGEEVADATSIYTVGSQYAGDAAVWIRNLGT